MPYAGALLTSFYAAIDALDAGAVVATLSPDARWHALATTDGPASTVVGREAIGPWLAERFAGLDAVTQTLVEVLDEGTAAAVFTTVVTVQRGVTTTVSRLDTFRFAEGSRQRVRQPPGGLTPRGTGSLRATVPGPLPAS